MDGRAWGMAEGRVSPLAPLGTGFRAGSPELGPLGALALSPDHGLLSRPPQDISLEEFDDEDLSEITDDCGLGLSYDSDPCEKVGSLAHRAPPQGEPPWRSARRSLGVHGGSGPSLK